MVNTTLDCSAFDLTWTGVGGLIIRLHVSCEQVDQRCVINTAGQRVGRKTGAMQRTFCERGNYSATRILHTHASCGSSNPVNPRCLQGESVRLKSFVHGTVFNRWPPVVIDTTFNSLLRVYLGGEARVVEKQRRN